jgi:hypothetical protein
MGTVEIEMPIPEVGLSPTLTKLLRLAACDNMVVPLEDRHGTTRLVPRAHGDAPVDAAPVDDAPG